MRYRLLTAAIVSILCTAATARADVVFSNLSPTDTYQNSVYPISTLSYSLPFTPTATYRLDSVELGLIRSGLSATNSVTVSLWSSNAGVPDTQIEQIGTLTNFANTSAATSPLEVFTSPGNPLLQAGVEYIIIAHGPGTMWGINNQGISDTPALVFGVWQRRSDIVQPAGRVNGTLVVPSPAALPAGLAVLGLIAARRRR